MKREELEHLIRAAAAVTNQYELMIIGSQSILGAHPTAPSELLVSTEADIYPVGRPDLADLIEGAIGEGSGFERAFGYYAQGVGPDTAVLPEGWESRLVKVQNQNTDMKIGYCLSPEDLAASKLVAGRDKDWRFVSAMLEHKIVTTELLGAMVKKLPIEQTRKNALALWLSRFNQSGPTPARPESAVPKPK